MTQSLKHTIKVLEQVSFNKELFVKELKKAKAILLPYELDQLKKWIEGFVKSRNEFNDVLTLV